MTKQQIQHLSKQFQYKLNIITLMKVGFIAGLHLTQTVYKKWT